MNIHVVAVFEQGFWGKHYAVKAGGKTMALVDSLCCMSVQRVDRTREAGELDWLLQTQTLRVRYASGRMEGFSNDMSTTATSKDD